MSKQTSLENFNINARGKLVAGQDALEQLIDGGNIAVGVKGVFGETVGVMTGKHQLPIHIRAMGNVLQRFLNTKRARVGLFAIVPGGLLGPVAEPARA